MYEATFELETLTPLFMRGADQSRAEFRPASVKGVMRWWFRALAGNYFGDNIAKLREAECRVFGCAGSGRSRVTVEVESKSRSKNVFFRFRSGVFDRDSWINDVRYLFFSLKMTLPKMRSNPTFYPPGSKFKVTLKSYSLNDLKLAILSLWLAVTFGGFGFRARRGAGSMRIISMRGNNPEINNFLKLLNIKTVIKAVKHPENKDGNRGNPENELRDFLKESFGKGPIKEQDETSYPLLRNIVVLVKEVNSPKDAIKKLEEAYAGSFDQHRWRYVGGVRFEFADYNFSRIVKLLSKNTQDNTGKNKMKEKRFFFGLPLIYANFKSATITAFRDIKTKDDKETRRLQYERRASPVWLSVKKINGKYYAMVTLLPAKFLPDGYKLQLTKFNKNLELDPPKETLSRFLREVYREFINNKGFREVNTVFGTSRGEF